MSEQHRIVTKVDELMALCDRLEAAQAERERRRDRLVAASLKRLNEPASAGEAREHVRFHLNHLPRLTTRREQVKELREAILNLAVAGRLVPRDSSEEGANALVERIRSDKNRPPWRGALVLGESSALPVGWEAVGLGNLCRFVTSGSRGWAEFYSATGPKFIRAQNIRFGRLLLKDLARVTPPDKREKARTQVSKGDLLIVITGAGVTHPAVLDEDLGEAYISQHVSSLRPALTELSPWLLLWLMAPAGGRAELVHRAYGAGKPGLNLENIRSLTTHVPPMAEQHRIVAKVDELMAVCDKLEAQLSASETESTRLLEATLHQALAVA